MLLENQCNKNLGGVLNGQICNKATTAPHPNINRCCFYYLRYNGNDTGDPAVRILGHEASVEALEEMREELGLNKPFLERFFNYLYNIFTKLDFGKSYRTRKPVLTISLRVPVSIKVAFLGMVFATIMGLPMGVYSAVKQYSPMDNFLEYLQRYWWLCPLFGWLCC